MKRAKEQRMEKGGLCTTCSSEPSVPPVAVFSVHFWNDKGKDGSNPDASVDPVTGRVDLTNWDQDGKPDGKGGTAVNYDYGYCANNVLVHTDMYHNPDKDRDGIGDFYPERDIRKATILRSTLAEWQSGAPNYYQYEVFNGEAWCVQCRNLDWLKWRDANGN
jgi:hypothetical protein